MPAGRPTSYREEYCQKLIDHMGSGYSFESFGAKIGVGRATIYRWIDLHSEFRDAKKVGFEKNLEWMERQAVTGMFTEHNGRKLNTTLWIFLMKARHGLRDGGESDQARDESIKIDSDDKEL